MLGFQIPAYIYSFWVLIISGKLSIKWQNSKYTR